MYEKDALVGTTTGEEGCGLRDQALINSDNSCLDYHLQLRLVQRISLVTQVTFTHRLMRSEEGDMFIHRLNLRREERKKKTANQFVLTLKGGDKELFSLDGSQLKVLISRRINSEVSQLKADLSTRSASLKTFNYYFFRRIQLERVAQDLNRSLQTFLSSCDNNSSCGWMMDGWRDGNRIIQTS